MAEQKTQSNTESNTSRTPRSKKRTASKKTSTRAQSVSNKLDSKRSEKSEEKKPMDAKKEGVKTEDTKTTKKVDDKGVSNNMKSSKETENKTSTKTKKGIKIKVKYLVQALVLVAVIALLYIFRGQFIVATVNGQPITRWDLVKQMEDQAGQQILYTMVNQKLIEQEASKLNITIDDQRIQEEFLILEGQFAAQGISMQDALALQGITEDDIKKNIRIQLIMEEILKDAIAVSDDDVKNLIESNDLGEATPDRIAQYKEQLRQQKLAQESEMWLRTLRDNAQIDYWLFPEPPVSQ